MQVKHKAMDFVRLGAALAMSQGHRKDAEGVAIARWGADSPALRLVKAGVPAGSTQDGSWGEPLTESERAGAAFFEAVAELSVIGRMRSLRRVPAHVPCLTRVANFGAEWRGEGKARPLDAAVFDQEQLELCDLGVLTVVTRELLEHGSRLAEQALTASLVTAVADALDQAFLDPTNAGVATVRPASITHGVDPVTVETTLTEAVGDMVAEFAGDVEAAYFILHPATAARLSGADHPGLGIRGGEFLGAPALTSRHAPPGKITLADGAGIALAEGSAGISTSAHATVEMRDDPVGDGGAPTAATQVSLWQTDLRAMLVSRRINWQVIRPGSVAVLDLEGDD